VESYDNFELLVDVVIPSFIPNILHKYFKASFERNRFSN
jgi:hypothetical protein